MLTGILIGVVSSVYFWGIPLIQKNRDVSVQESSETFMKNLNEKIKDVANIGGKEEIRIPIDGIMVFNATDQSLIFEIKTDGSIYAANAIFPLEGKDCVLAEGEWGQDEPESLCVYSRTLGSKYIIQYILKYRTLSIEEVGLEKKSYKISLDGESQRGGKDHRIIIERGGTLEEGNLIKTVILINIV
jgi:hypothetical protein